MILETRKASPGYKSVWSKNSPWSLQFFGRTSTEIGWNASWLRHGGSPHGMGAAPDLWQSLGPFLVWFGRSQFYVPDAKAADFCCQHGWTNATSRAILT